MGGIGDPAVLKVKIGEKHRFLYRDSLIAFFLGKKCKLMEKGLIAKV